MRHSGDVQVARYLGLDRLIFKTEDSNDFSHAVGAVVEAEECVIVLNAGFGSSDDDGLEF